MDFAWDPFDDNRLVVACDDAKIKVWNIPEGEWSETLTEPDDILRGMSYGQVNSWSRVALD